METRVVDRQFTRFEQQVGGHPGKGRAMSNEQKQNALARALYTVKQSRAEEGQASKPKELLQDQLHAEDRQLVEIVTLLFKTSFSLHAGRV